MVVVVTNVVCIKYYHHVKEDAVRPSSRPNDVCERGTSVDTLEPH
jgi:hypothetical protein